MNPVQKHRWEKLLRSEDQEWWDKVASRAPTKNLFFVERVFMRMQSWIQDLKKKFLRKFRGNRRYSKDVKAAVKHLISFMEASLNAAKAKQHPLVLCQYIFDYTVQASLRRCSERGEMICGGLWNDERDVCPITHHSIHPYENPEDLEDFQLMQIDHEVGRAHMFDTYVEDAIKKEGKVDSLNDEKFLTLFFRIENMRIVHQQCHDNDKEKVGRVLTVKCFFLP